MCRLLESPIQSLQKRMRPLRNLYEGACRVPWAQVKACLSAHVCAAWFPHSQCLLVESGGTIPEGGPGDCFMGFRKHWPLLKLEFVTGVSPPCFKKCPRSEYGDRLGMGGERGDGGEG